MGAYTSLSPHLVIRAPDNTTTTSSPTSAPPVPPATRPEFENDFMVYRDAFISVIVILVIFAVCAWTIWFLYRYRREKYNRMVECLIVISHFCTKSCWNIASLGTWKKRITKLLKGQPPTHDRESSTCGREDSSGHVRYEIAPWRLTVERESVLGVGQFGKVYRGCLSNAHAHSLLEKSPEDRDFTIVAVKELRNKSDQRLRQEFFAEIDIAKKIGRHLNIVNLLGVMTKDDVYLVMEYCALGSLDRCLRHNRKKLLGRSMALDSELASSSSQSESTGSSVKSLVKRQGQLRPDDAVLRLEDLVNFCYQICRGMAYIASKGIVHRDLASRNVLLDTEMTAKICDFGMARDESEYTLERTNVPLPLKWMAPESIVYKYFTTKSDIWSFGVVVWEIFTLGDSPYSEMFRDVDTPGFLQYLNQGNRLQRPDLIPDVMSEWMHQCWEWKPEDRPSFEELAEKLRQLTPSALQDYYIDCDTKNAAINKDTVILESTPKISRAEQPESSIGSDVSPAPGSGMADWASHRGVTIQVA